MHSALTTLLNQYDLGPTLLNQYDLGPTLLNQYDLGPTLFNQYDLGPTLLNQYDLGPYNLLSASTVVQVGLEGPKFRPSGDEGDGGLGDMLRRRHHASALRREAADAVAGRWGASSAVGAGGRTAGGGPRKRRSSKAGGEDDSDGDDDDGGGDSGEELSGPAPRASGRQHRSNCMCIICKQARGSGGTWGGMGQGGLGDATPAGGAGLPSLSRLAPALRIHYGANGQPQLRFGKRAFVEALPALPIGLSQHRYRKDVGLMFVEAEAIVLRGRLSFLLWSITRYGLMSILLHPYMPQS